MADEGKRLGFRGGDFVVHKESHQKCFSSSRITAPAIGGPFNLDTVTAYPLLANGVLAKAGDEANVVAFIIFGKSIADLADSGVTKVSEPYTIMDGFDGAVLNESVIPANDASAAAGAFNIANIKGATALANVKWVTEPDPTLVQTN